MYCRLGRLPRAVAIVLLFAGVAIGASAQSYRNIASISFDYNFDESYEATVENVFLAPLSERTTLGARVQQIGGTNRSLTMLSLGPVFTFPPNVYTIARYGIGIEGDGDFIHELDLQANYETAGYRIGIGARGQYHPAEEDYYVVPSLSGRLNLPAGFGAQATYFFSWNSDGDISNAIWAEGDYRINNWLTVKLGGTVDIGADPDRNDDNRLSYSGITGATFALSDSVNLRYHFEYFARRSTADGMRNLMLVDWRF